MAKRNPARKRKPAESLPEKAKTKTQLVREIALKNPGMRTAAIARQAECSVHTAQEALGDAPFKVIAKDNKYLQDNQEAVWNQVTLNMISSLSSRDLESMAPDRRIWCAAVASDKAFRAATGADRRIDLRILQVSAELSSDEIDLLRRAAGGKGSGGVIDIE